MVNPHVDLSGALAMAQAMGTPAEIAATLLVACADGVVAGMHERRKSA